MTNEILNVPLCQQILKEQKIRQWLLAQPAEEILRYSYKYNIRQAILCSLEHNVE